MYIRGVVCYKLGIQVIINNFHQNKLKMGSTTSIEVNISERTKRNMKAKKIKQTKIFMSTRLYICMAHLIDITWSLLLPSPLTLIE